MVLPLVLRGPPTAETQLGYESVRGYLPIGPQGFIARARLRGRRTRRLLCLAFELIDELFCFGTREFAQALSLCETEWSACAAEVVVPNVFEE